MLHTYRCPTVTSVPVSSRWRRVFVNIGALLFGCFYDGVINLQTEYLSEIFRLLVDSVAVRVMGQRQSGAPGAAATARYQPYTSSLTVDGGSSADRQSPSTGRMPSSATATPDHHLRHLRPAVATGGRLRALSLGNFPGPSSSSSASAVAGSQTASVGGAIGGAASSPDSDDDSGDDSGGGLFGALAAMSSMPPALTLYRGSLFVKLIC